MIIKDPLKDQYYDFLYTNQCRYINSTIVYVVCLWILYSYFFVYNEWINVYYFSLLMIIGLF